MIIAVVLVIILIIVVVIIIIIIKQKQVRGVSHHHSGRLLRLQSPRVLQRAVVVLARLQRSENSPNSAGELPSGKRLHNYENHHFNG